MQLWCWARPWSGAGTAESIELNVDLHDRTLLCADILGERSWALLWVRVAPEEDQFSPGKFEMMESGYFFPFSGVVLKDHGAGACNWMSF